jgi:hypothetical protein
MSEEDAVVDTTISNTTATAEELEDTTGAHERKRVLKSLGKRKNLSDEMVQEEEEEEQPQKKKKKDGNPKEKEKAKSKSKSKQPKPKEKGDKSKETKEDEAKKSSSSSSGKKSTIKLGTRASKISLGKRDRDSCFRLNRLACMEGDKYHFPHSKIRNIVKNFIQKSNHKYAYEIQLPKSASLMIHRVVEREARDMIRKVCLMGFKNKKRTVTGAQFADFREILDPSSPFYKRPCIEFTQTTATKKKSKKL